VTNLQSFASAKELAKLAAEWPAARSVEAWNSFAGGPVRLLAAGEEVHHPHGGGLYLGSGPAFAPGRCATGGMCRARQGEGEEVPLINFFYRYNHFIV
jgi:hypothetical protein